ncbi:hypothetical protein L207DRAFT_510873 [Hyaloscypha variabilis F]|uniref:Uncharacterized protein n=1 Tax=Hyaloscypha variabilis (strain UAMH 11265 / GT02V1 / F) TaxID=1149755 RepID=A0A2J6RVT8_HYAVF|nr:hypothetical protein L207DRAFT_510873 [Hyaloscypha variabilis F]
MRQCAATSSKYTSRYNLESQRWRSHGHQAMLRHYTKPVKHSYRSPARFPPSLPLFGTAGSVPPSSLPPSYHDPESKI